MRLALLLCLLNISFALTAQTFSSPESVKYDAPRNRYIVANTSANNLQSVVPGNAPVLFKSGVTSPYGLCIVGDTLYVCAQTGYLKGYDLNTAAQVINLNMGGSFLNGICADNSGNIYVSDFSAKKIYRYNIASQDFNVFVSATGKTPNGLAYDYFNNRLVVATWGPSASILGVSLTDSSVTTLKSTSLTNIDGISMDGEGNFFTSEWGTDDIYFFDKDFLNSPLSVVNGSSTNPADIFYNILNDTLAVPNTSTNTVTFYPFPRPTVMDDTISVCTDSSALICVLDNDSLASGTLAIQSFTFAQLGNAGQNGDCIQYTASQTGYDTIYCTICTNALPSFCKTSSLIVNNSFCGDTSIPSFIHADFLNPDFSINQNDASLTVKTISQEVMDVTLIDISGKLIAARSNNSEINISTSDLSPGIYVLYAVKGQQRFLKKVVIN